MKTLSESLIRDTAMRAAAAARRRTNHNLHAELADPVQRFLNAIEPESYVRPHRHREPPRWELFVALAGRAAVLTFDGAGVVEGRVEIAPDGPERGVELPAGGWHTLVALVPGTVLLEVKAGPYVPLRPEDFAAWAPAEGEAGWEAVLAWMREARVGESLHPTVSGSNQGG